MRNSFVLSSLALALALLGAAPARTAPPRPRRPQSTPAAALKVLKGFKAELLYSVPKDTQGSWVNMCVDAKGRLIVSDQYGGLYRVTPPPLGTSAGTKVAKIDVPLGEAQGLLWAFDSLYVVVNRGNRYQSGLYRVRCPDGEHFGKVELLRKIDGGGEHGPHAVLLSPDGKALYVVCGDGTKMMSPLAKSRVPRIWGEDHLLPRMPDGNGFMRGVLGPGGYICRVDPDGKSWELVSVGYRNQFDAAFNRHGELFTFDADMEWDINTPWYRPTRVCLATSGSEFGWRNGAGKWPLYYPDNLPAVVNVGPGSPTGVCFGYGAKFPAKYQEAFFICDWSYGKLYAVHLTPELSGYKGELEEFVSGSPLALTDVVINPKDGAMYFTVGGRQTQSGLYRITYVGKEATTPAPERADAGAEFRTQRHRLEAFHGRKDPKAVDTAWPFLGHADRYLRFAARVALEHQEPQTWSKRALAEKDPQAALTALLGLVRVSASDPFHRPKNAPPLDTKLKDDVFQALGRLDWTKLNDEQRIELLRVYEVALNRMGPPAANVKKALVARLDVAYPSKGREQNAELVQLLVFLEAPHVVAKTLKLMAAAPTQEEQMAYGMALRVLKSGWTMPQRQQYFKWFLRAANFKGGASLQGFLRMMKADAVATLTAAEKAELKPILEARPAAPAPIVGKPRPFVKKWTLDEATTAVEKGLKTRRDFDRGRRLFGEANCFACHRFDNEGGSMGPDLTGLAGRFSVRDLLESVVEPSKVISDQYANVIITTTDGKVVIGRIVNLGGDTLHVNTNMLDPNAQAHVNRKKVESIETSKISPMPDGLLDTLKEDEIVDLMAFLLSRGDRKARFYK